MADVERFVDTAADAGGDGTTRNHSSGDSTHAYASLAAWESAEGADLVTATDTHRVRCAGSTADTTETTVNGFTTNSSFFVTIQGDDVGGDGFYDGNLVWSTSHYRMEVSGGFRALRIQNDFTVVDGIQLQCTKNSSFAFCLQLEKPSTIARNCRITSVGNTVEAGLSLGDNTIANVNGLAYNNIVFDCAGLGIRAEASGTSAQTFDVYNNTVFDCTTGIKNGTDNADLTYNFFNNAFFNNTTDMSLIEVSATVNHDWNAGEDAPPTDETNGVTIGTLTDAMTDPSNATMKSRNVQVKDSGSSLFKASEITNADDSNVPTVDIVGNTRNTATGTSTSVGAWANISEAAAGFVARHPIRRQPLINW